METALVAGMAILMVGAVIVCWRVERLSNKKGDSNVKQGGTENESVNVDISNFRMCCRSRNDIIYHRIVYYYGRIQDLSDGKIPYVII